MTTQVPSMFDACRGRYGARRTTRIKFILSGMVASSATPQRVAKDETDRGNGNSNPPLGLFDFRIQVATRCNRTLHSLVFCAN
jgi:hypothetical protein